MTNRTDPFIEAIGDKYVAFLIRMIRNLVAEKEERNQTIVALECRIEYLLNSVHRGV